MEDLVRQIHQICVDKKCIDPVIIDISEQSSFAEKILIASANARQMATVADEIIKGCKESLGVNPHHAEGKGLSGWILLDYGYMIVNLMTPECREFYNLEKLWGDGSIVNLGKDV